MRCVRLALVMAVLVPGVARGEPIAVSVASAARGFSQSGSVLADAAISLGTVVMPTAGSAGNLLFAGPLSSADYVVSFMLEGIGNFNTLRLELLNPSSPVDRWDPHGQPDWMPAGFSTSNDVDGLSFSQGSALERSAVFAGGAATVTADELTHRGDILLFSGLHGANRVIVTFGIRDRLSFFSEDGRGRGFMLHISAGDAVHAPEPASMILLGSGLAGVIAVRRRRSRASH
jgi:hypothetical protein